MAKTKKSQDATKASKVTGDELIRFVPTKEINDQFGRPKVISLEVLKDLKYAFLIGCTNREAALYAGISEQTYYNFVNGLDVELNGDFLGLVEAWKNDMILAARQTLRRATSTPEHAKWLLERRRKDEFAPRTQHEIKEVSDFDSLSDEELEKIANAGHTANQGADRTSETQK
jgi:hypothetical protein